MNANRLWIIGSVAAMVAVIVLGWIVGVSPQLAAAASANVQRQAAQSQNAANEATLASLKKDYARIGDLKRQLAALKLSMPESTRFSAFIREISSAADATGASVTDITISDTQAYAPPAVTATAATSTPTPAPGAASTSTPAPTSGSSATAAPTAAPVAGLPLTDPKITATNFVVIPVSLSVTGSADQVLAFTGAMQKGSRLFLVDKYTSAGDNSAHIASLAGFVYVLQHGSGSAG